MSLTDGVRAPHLPCSLKLDALATDKACEGVTSPLAVCFLGGGRAAVRPSRGPFRPPPRPRISLASPRI